MENDNIYATVQISNRHIHLKEETYYKLFNEELSIKKLLGQKGEFAANQTVTIKGSKGIIENVRVMGPFRNYNQVEISKTDAYTLGVNPPVRASGNIDNSENITVIGPLGEIELKESCIIAQRHVHMNEIDASNLGFENSEMVELIVNSVKGGKMEAYVKVTPNGFYEIHLDTDDANSFMLKNGDKIELRKISK